MRTLWKSLADGQRRWIVINAVIVTAAINALLNWAIAWAATDAGERVPLFSATGETSVITDSLGTLFVLPLITTLLVTTAVRAELRAGRLDPVRSAVLPLELPPQRLLRGFVFGALTLSLLAGPVALALTLADYGDLGRGEFATYKAVYGVVLGAIVTPVIAVRAMADEVGPARA